MTDLLEKAFQEAANLPTEEQDVLHHNYRLSLAAEDDFDRDIARGSDNLAAPTRKALAEHCAGNTKEFDPTYEVARRFT